MDEITTTAPSRISELKDGQVRTSDFDPAPFFGGYAKPDDLKGGNAMYNAELLRDILTGADRGPRRNIVLLNSAYSLLAADRCSDLPSALKLSAESIDSGAAVGKLDALLARLRNAK
jgi:anthranilate phosphoribosyltransferase